MIVIRVFVVAAVLVITDMRGAAVLVIADVRGAVVFQLCYPFWVLGPPSSLFHIKFYIVHRRFRIVSSTSIG